MQMDGVTQSNAAQVEELSGTSQSLATQAEQMMGMVSHFTLKAEAVKHFVSSAGVGEKMKTAASDSKPTGSLVASESGTSGKSVKARNVQYLKPRVVAQKASSGGGDWTEF
jgi:methyl-accepting chemotaxis protein